MSRRVASPRRGRRFAASLALLGLAGPLALLAPAGVGAAQAAPASSCSGRQGVVVVVDFAELGGGTTKGCSARGGTAAKVFEAAGYDLTYATSQPDFVCRVSGKPASDPCQDASPATAYWSLWTNDGKGGGWKYATRGATSLRLVEGGYVAFAWHQGRGDAQPPVTPAVRTAAAPAAPAAAPTKGGAAPSKGPRTTPPAAASAPAATSSAEPSASGGASASPSAAATGRAGAPSASATPGGASSTAAAGAEAPAGAASPATTDDLPSVDPAAAPVEDDGGGLPVWLGALIGVGVLTIAVAVPLLRRRVG
ncbi:hypothetical protein [Nocardioides sp.]|uniref:hypothetical protein n=1 Tax=Nocardioides sp. TaxID=35761 RepID=UPI003518596B